ncbi:hypothetical protein KVT40_004239 [Elsinoe batatas]|uniref:Uncharacterized protein n=1 Tax=Elsinoe batatas TaxID=2601811 RepID=A0A8K0PFY3_9PEZI|nr:hypothetical protein KVT40_004239 [Elsinoe batatas]
MLSSSEGSSTAPSSTSCRTRRHVSGLPDVSTFMRVRTTSDVLAGTDRPAEECLTDSLSSSTFPEDSQKAHDLSWECKLSIFYNFLSPDLQTLLCLMSAFGDQVVPSLIFQKVTQRPHHWTTSGAQDVIISDLPNETGQDDSINIRLRELEPFLVVGYRGEEAECYQISSVFVHAAHTLLGKRRRRWLRQVRNLLFFVCPKISSWSASCTDLRIAYFLRPLMISVFDEDPVNDFTQPWRSLAAECEISMARSVAPDIRLPRLLSHAHLFDSDPALLMHFRFEKAMALHLTRHFGYSEGVLRGMMQGVDLSTLPALANAIRGHAHALHIENVPCYSNLKGYKRIWCQRYDLDLA